MDIEKIMQTARNYFTYVKRHQYSLLKGAPKASFDTLIHMGMEENYHLPGMTIFSDYRKGRKKRIEGAFVKEKDTLHIFFMATNTNLDWITNLFFFKKRVPYNNVKNREVKVHSGYCKRYTLNSIRTKILLYTAKNPDIKNVIVSGYSMGGGLAPICAVDVAYNFPKLNVSCLSFAGPRVGNKAFLDSIINQGVQFKHFAMTNDIVPKLPPKLFGFKHPDSKARYGKKTWIGLSVRDHYPDRLFGYFLSRLKLL
jgi:triacylglycerol lipase